MPRCASTSGENTSDGAITVKNVSGNRMSRCTDPAMLCASAIVNASMSFAHGIATKLEFDMMKPRLPPLLT